MAEQIALAYCCAGLFFGFLAYRCIDHLEGGIAAPVVGLAAFVFWPLLAFYLVCAFPMLLYGPLLWLLNRCTWRRRR